MFYAAVKKVPGGKLWTQKCLDRHSCSLNNLQSGESYIITVFAENSAGRGGRSSPILVVIPAVTKGKEIIRKRHAGLYPRFYAFQLTLAPYSTLSSDICSYRIIDGIISLSTLE